MKRTWAAGVVVMVACRQPATATIVNEQQQKDPPVGAIAGQPMVAVMAARPDIDLSAVLPDPSEELRWPLTMTSHPVLEPQFPIAAALAVPGVTWTDLCARGAQNRHASGGHELVEYLHAWCDVTQHDAEAAIGFLGPLTHPAILGMGPAVIIDIANILADAGSADAALHLLAKLHIKDIEIFDTLAATYVEVGRAEDARAINQIAIDNDPFPHDVVRCHREARRIVLAEPLSRAPMVIDLKKAQAHAIDPTCLRLVHELACWVEPENDCVAYLVDQGIDLRYAELLAAYMTWPVRSATYSTWMAIAQHAMGAMPLADADLLATSALESSLETSSCDLQRFDDINAGARRLLLDPKHATSLNHRLTRMIGAIASFQRMTNIDCHRAREAP